MQENARSEVWIRASYLSTVDIWGQIIFCRKNNWIFVYGGILCLVQWLAPSLTSVQ